MQLAVTQILLLNLTVKNTAPAILAAALVAQKSNNDAMLLAMPADHHIPDFDSFAETIAEGLAAANNGGVVTFGVKPSRVETGYRLH